MIAYNERRHRRKVAEFQIGELNVPANRAILRIEADQVCVRRSKVQPILVHAQSAIANVVAFGNTLVMPDFPPVARIYGPNVVGHREVENAVHFQRRRFDGGQMRLEDPGERKRADVSSIDLVERAEATARIIPVIGRPGIGCGLEQSRCVEPLRRKRRYIPSQRKQQEDYNHCPQAQRRGRLILKTILARAPALDHSTQQLRKHFDSYS